MAPANSKVWISVVAVVATAIGALKLYRQLTTKKILKGGYRLREDSVKQTKYGITALLEAVEGNSGIQLLRADMCYENGNARVKITDENVARWIVPDDIAPLSQNNSRNARDLFTLTMDSCSLSIARKVKGRLPLVNISLSTLVYYDQYIHYRTEVPKDPYLVGMGTHNQKRLSLQENVVTTIWNVDQFSLPYGDNLYSTHPHYIEIRDGLAHGVLLRNANGQDWCLHSTTLQTTLIGGIMDFFVFAGPTVDEACLQYQQLVGLPWMPPYWALGWQQCKYGFKDIVEVKQTYDEYKRQEIPLQVIYIDIDYMDRWRNFTVHPTKFPVNQFEQFVQSVHADDRHLTVIINPSISQTKAGDSYKAYDRGVEKDVFIKTSEGRIYRSRQWAGDVAILDPTSTCIKEYIVNELCDWWKNEIKFDGLWLDMNEFASFVHGEVNTEMPFDWVDHNEVLWKHPAWVQNEHVRNEVNAMSAQQVLDTDFEAEYALDNGGSRRYEDNLNNPPYAVHNCVAGVEAFSLIQGNAGGGIFSFFSNAIQKCAPLFYKTFDMTALYASGAKQYNMHNLYGHAMARHVRAAADAIPRRGRPFLLTRSTFSGSGSFCGTWNGDNVGNWDQYASGMHTCIKAQVHGLLYVGDDSGGFVDDSSLGDDEYDTLLCRWSALSAFYPFARNHMAFGSGRLHQPWETPAAANAARNALNLRYQLLPYLYTQFALAHLGEIALVIRALYFDYPKDIDTRDVQDQFMFGPSIMVCPVMQYRATSRVVYFPRGTQWYDWNTGAVVSTEGGESEKFDSSIEDNTIIRLFGKGGHVVITQRLGSELTVKSSRETPVTMVIMYDSPNHGGKANGHVFWDDGEQREMSKFVRVSYTATSDRFQAKALNNSFDGPLPPVHAVKLYGLKKIFKSAVVRTKGQEFTILPHIARANDTGTIILGLDKFGLNLGTSFQLDFA
eukprot:CFRG6132T1